MEIKLVAADTEERLSGIEQLYMAALPEAERQPFDLLRKKREEGYADILSIESGEEQMLGEAAVQCI